MCHRLKLQGQLDTHGQMPESSTHIFQSAATGSGWNLAEQVTRANQRGEWCCLPVSWFKKDEYSRIKISSPSSLLLSFNQEKRERKEKRKKRKS